VLPVPRSPNPSLSFFQIVLPSAQAIPLRAPVVEHLLRPTTVAGAFQGLGWKSQAPSDPGGPGTWRSDYQVAGEDCTNGMPLAC
jgi:hypothetical protein